MTTSTVWHAPRDVLARFAVEPAAVDAATAASVEAHLVACATCRSELARLADPELVAASWEGVADRIDRPRASLLERALELLGVGSGPARLVAATPGLRLSGVAAVIALTALAVVAARNADADGPFLAVAPLVPLAAVALTFAAARDPGGEAGVATAIHGAGLALRRAVAVLALAFSVLGLGALGLPTLGPTPLGWVLPALALASASLALGTWFRIEPVLVGLAGAWLSGVGVLRYLEGIERPFADSALFAAGGQALALAVALAGIAALGARADRYSTVEAGR